MAIAYTNHIGRSSRDKHSGKSTNISSIADLAAAEKHNNHDYNFSDVGRMQSAIDLDNRHLNRQYEMHDGELVEIRGHLDLEGNVRKIYEEQFNEAVEKYNQRQLEGGHPERQIDSYIEKISADKQQDVAVEGMIQFGSLEDWRGRSTMERLLVVPLLIEALKLSLEELNHGDSKFLLAGASLHLNEGSPHLHYVGVPVQDTPNAKKGLTRRVSKSAVFTKEALGTGFQDNVRAKIEPMIEEAFGWTFEEKRTGRNEDLEKNVYVNELIKKEIGDKAIELVEIEEALKQQIEGIKEAVESEVEMAIEEVVDGSQDVYENAFFYLQACSDEEFSEIDKKGREEKTKVISNIVPESKKMAGDLLQNIARAKPSELSWQDRVEKWGEYGEVSNHFWNVSRMMTEFYKSNQAAVAAEKIAADRLYYDALYLLDTSRGLIGMLIAAVKLLVAEIKRDFFAVRLIDLQRAQKELIKNTTSFAKFSRAYREDLKAGKIPHQKYWDSLKAIVKDMDQEYMIFCRSRVPEREIPKELEKPTK